MSPALRRVLPMTPTKPGAMSPFTSVTAASEDGSVMHWSPFMRTPRDWNAADAGLLWRIAAFASSKNGYDRGAQNRADDSAVVFGI